MGANSSIPLDEQPGGPRHQTHLLYKNTWRVDSANRIFGACYNGNTVVIINPGRNPVKPYIRIPEGTYALVQNQGRDMDYTMPDGSRSAVWPPGLHMTSIFSKVAHLITKQYIVFDTPVKGCKTADDVTVTIDMCLVLRIMGDASKGEDPELVRRFVYELGPNGLEEQLRAAQEEAVRGLARSVMHTEVYQLRDGTMKERFNTGALDFRTGLANRSATDELTTPKSTDGMDGGVEPVPEAKVFYCVTEDIKRNLNNQFNTYGVEITSVAITDVKLPDTFQEQMQSRTTHLSAIKEQNQKQMSDMQMLNYKEEIDMTKLQRQMLLMETEQTGKAQCAEIQKEIDLINGDIKLVEQQIIQEQRVRCNNVIVAAELKMAQIRADREQVLSEVSASCDADNKMLEAEKGALDLQLKATVDEILVSAKAEAAKIVSRAEGEAAKKMVQVRAHDLRMKRLDMISALAKNDKTVISGDTSNSLLADVLVANRQQSVIVNVDGRGKGT